jgi:uncharacterized 2Fe-2S/4Fe-4S cluster protein (DUF4445 family)
MNPQTAFGDDVVSRILHARQGPQHLHELQNALLSAVNAMLGSLAGQAGIDRNRIYAVAFAGNTTMQHLLSGVNPGALGEVPFVPVTCQSLLLDSEELGCLIHPRGQAYVFPVIGGFVGGDTVAGLLATRLSDAFGPTLFVDIGTNGEIVLAHEGKMSAASCAAGPAFEGARISQGMRAAAGAIEKVVFDGAVRYSVIGNAPPVGLCGSALIDLAAELLRHGVLLPEGLFVPPGQLPSEVPPAIRERVVPYDGAHGFVLAPADETGMGAPLILTQRDVRELQLATAAIRAGIAILLRRAGLRSTDLYRVLVAGGFGNFIRRSNAQRIGLLPSELPHSRISFVGNTSLAGARLAAVSQSARRQAEELARRPIHIDLSQDVHFHEEFVEAMFFPADCPADGGS